MLHRGQPEGNWRVSDGVGKVWLDINPHVFISSVIIIIIFVTLSLISLSELSSAIDGLQGWIANKTGWFFVLTVNVILAYLFYLMVSPFGAIRLGGRGSKPEFSYLGWFAMIFSAGMGIGLMFYGVAEPIFHLTTPPHGAEPGSVKAYEDAISTTFLHWGLHAWGIYTLTGLAIAYFSFNKNQILSIRGVFRPILGDRVNGIYGHIIDVVAAVATLVGVATSLGLGVTQISAGLNYQMGTPDNSTTHLILIVSITLIATGSVVLGLSRGIQNLSRFNMIVASILLLYVIFTGPTLFILNGFIENIGLYMDQFFYLAFWNETYTQGNWQNGWTVFYWGWWIAWSPFVGMFVARVSYGRTIREFIFGVLIVATLLTFVWLSVFGNSALFMELMGNDILSNAVNENIASSLFVFLENLPLTHQSLELPPFFLKSIGILTTVVIISFFVTSSDSGSLVIDIITAGGHSDPPVLQRIFWALTEGLVAAILLIAGGLSALQTATISAGFPFAVLILFMIVNLNKVLEEDSD